MKLVTVVGARPQFIKAAPVGRALRALPGVREVLVHTGQHYDDTMSAVFFRELDLPPPDYHLGIGSGSHAAQTGAMLPALEVVLLAEQPAGVIIYGDTNSTLAAALVAAKLGLPVAHVEAGLRSYNRTMPEEINRVVADSLAALLFCPSPISVANLAREGITAGVAVVGDVMYDAVLAAAARSAGRDTLLRLGLQPGGYLLATVHRAGNTDDPARLGAIVAALNALTEPVVFPVHPRTAKALAALGHPLAAHIQPIAPQGYLDMIALERGARLILTDSGGVQKEAYWLAVPCVTLREETEWVETVAHGWNRLVGTDPAAIQTAVATFHPTGTPPPVFGDGHAAEQIAAVLAEAWGKL